MLRRCLTGLAVLLLACGGGDGAGSKGTGGAGGSSGTAVGGGGANGSGASGAGGGGAAKHVDLLVAGAGLGGIAAAIEAARHGASVLLVEATGEVGGQKLLVAGPESMWEKSMQTGIIVEFLAATTEHYTAAGKPKAAALLSVEPHVARDVFGKMLADAHVEVKLHARVKSVAKSGSRVTGATLDDGTVIASKILVDATEVGDVIPLTGAAYRIGNTTGDAIDPNVCIQDITYPVTIRRYPNAVPADLIIASAPPGYDAMPSSSDPGLLFMSGFDYTTHEALELLVANGGSETYSYPLSFYFHNQYRKMPDSASPDDIDLSILVNDSKITRTAINLTNDYAIAAVVNGNPVSSGKLSLAYVEDLAVRRRVDCFAKLLTLDFIHYMQTALAGDDPPGEGGDHWSIADDEGFEAIGDFDASACPEIPTALKPLERLFPPTAYVREGRRIVPINPLTGTDLARSATDAPSKPFHTALSRGYGAMDLHNCSDANDLESGLGDGAGYDVFNGPYQIPFDALVPKALDGFLAAEKNIGVSRLAAGNVRLQGNAFLGGQGIGALASLAVEHGAQPRDVDPFEVQRRLVADGVGIWFGEFSDVPSTDPHWGAIQLVATRGMIADPPDTAFTPLAPLTRGEAAKALATVMNYSYQNLPPTPAFTDVGPGDVNYEYVQALAQHHITSGCGGGNYCPASPLLRGQFAAFLTAALGLSYSGPALFTDIAGTPYYDAVQAVAHAGLVTGCTSTTFCATDPLVRADAADSLVEVMVLNGPPP